jgi:formamidopyrimidine-DNA glycosylase
MPELPEVETIVRGLRKTILGRTINSVWIKSPKISRNDSESIIKICRGRKFVSVERRGKNILMHLSGGHTLWVHLKMTGHFYFILQEGAIDKHDLMIFGFRNCRRSLHFNDYRRFGNIRPAKTDQLQSYKALAELGPEPLDINLSQFIALFRSSRRMIKPALLDQSFLAGLGNIYADEALYQAKIHPRRRTDTIMAKRLAELHTIIRRILRTAIANMGTSIDSFSGIDGRPGGYQKYLQVYGREGTPCRQCGTTIRREKIGSRSAHYCPRCQRMK